MLELHARLLGAKEMALTLTSCMSPVQSWVNVLTTKAFTVANTLNPRPRTGSTERIAACLKIRGLDGVICRRSEIEGGQWDAGAVALDITYTVHNLMDSDQRLRRILHCCKG